MVPSETKLLYLLSNNDVTFFIPPYQRNYEWTNDQCIVFLNDIKKTYESNLACIQAEHFFGTITFFQTKAVFGQPNKLVLIDGQQRITTTMLFLVALRDILSDVNLHQFIDSKYLKNNNMSGDIEFKVKLKQVETDWNAYKNIILKRELTDIDKRSAVFRNYTYFRNELRTLQKQGYNLRSLIEMGLDKFSVVTIELKPDQNPWENPQEIFESMNSLGKPLSLADLVRNYLLLGLDADKQTYLYDQYWLHIERTVPGKVSGFIRDYMQAHEMKSFYVASEANYKELYSIFKNIFFGTNAEKLLKDLSESATIYSYCLGLQSTGSSLIDSYIQDFNRMKVTTAYSFLLKLLQTWKQGNFAEKELADILNAFRIYCMRRRLLSLTQAENKNFPTYCNWIQKLINSDNKKMHMFELLSEQESNLRLPNDIEVERILNSLNFYNFAHSKFFLSLVEESLTKSRPDLSDNKLQIEHIMPQKLNDYWTAVLGENAIEIHQNLVSTIGNLTLIRHNQELGNKRFDEKKKIYDQYAGLQIARTEITNKIIWDADAIRNRTRWITNHLLNNVLPIPDHLRKINNYKIKNNRRMSFQNLQLIGLDIEFIEDRSYKARVIDDLNVEFEGKKWRLAQLTREIQTRRGKVTPSGAYQGSRYWAYDGMKLSEFTED